jgi:hypothetical protein
MRATRRRPSTTEHGHAVSIRGYQSDPWSVERPPRSAPRSYPARAYGGALTEITPYQLGDRPPSACLVESGWPSGDRFPGGGPIRRFVAVFIQTNGVGDRWPALLIATTVFCLAADLIETRRALEQLPEQARRLARSGLAARSRDPTAPGGPRSTSDRK